MSEHTDITITAAEFEAQACERLLREVMGDPMANVGDESWMERWAQAEDSLAGGRIAMDLLGITKHPQTKPLLLLSTPQHLQSKFLQMHHDAVHRGTGAMSIFWDPAAPGADRSVDAGFVAIVHSDLLADMEALGKAWGEDKSPSLEEMRRAVAEVAAMAPPKSKFVEVQLNPQMAELVGAPAVEIRRDIYESLVRGPFDASAEL